MARHQDRLWAIALRMMRNPEDAADALQDAYISAFRHAATYRGEARVTTWLHRVVVNACLDRLRSLRVRAAEPLPEDLDRVAELGRAEPDRLEAQEQRDRVVAAMAMLNPDQRAALVLVDMYGYPVEEAAAILGCAIGTVKSRCARGRAKLAPLLATPVRGGGLMAHPLELSYNWRTPVLFATVGAFVCAAAVIRARMSGWVPALILVLVLWVILVVLIYARTRAYLLADGSRLTVRRFRTFHTVEADELIGGEPDLDPERSVVRAHHARARREAAPQCRAHCPAEGRPADPVHVDTGPGTAGRVGPRLP